jgi:hypothetical protein
MRDSGIRLSPAVTGMFSLNSAMTIPALATISGNAPTEMPRLTSPSAVGGEVWTTTTSGLIGPSR